MQSELLEEMTDKLEELGVERDEAEEILRELHERSYAEGYDQGIADTQEGSKGLEIEDPEDEEAEVREPWDPEDSEDLEFKEIKI